MAAIGKASGMRSLGEERAQIPVGQHRPHARQRARLDGVHGAQPRVRDRAAHESRMQETRQLQIVHEPAGAAQQARSSRRSTGRPLKLRNSVLIEGVKRPHVVPERTARLLRQPRK